MIYITGIAISFFLSALLLLKKNKSMADKILACWLVLIGVHLLLFYAFITGKIYSMPWVLGVHFPFPLLHGPLLYLYASALTSKLHSSNKKYLLHFIPALICYIYLFPFFLLPAEQKIFIFKNRGIGYETFQAILPSIIIISGVAYVILTIVLHRQHRRTIVNEFSNIEKINLDWIQYLIIGTAAIWTFVIFGNDDFIFMTAVFFVVLMGFFGIRQTPVFTTLPPSPIVPVTPSAEQLIDIDVKSPVTQEPLPFTNPAATEDKSQSSLLTEPSPELITEKSKYKKSGLDEEELKSIYERLTQLMTAKKLYTNPELTLGETAEQLQVHPNYLSQVINSVAKKNFYDYINSQRVEEFNRIVQDGKNKKFTLLSLAFECGFNSKTSFNRNFKKVTGQSPSEYLKQMNVSFDTVN